MVTDNINITISSTKHSTEKGTDSESDKRDRADGETEINRKTDLGRDIAQFIDRETDR